MSANSHNTWCCYEFKLKVGIRKKPTLWCRKTRNLLLVQNQWSTERWGNFWQLLLTLSGLSWPIPWKFLWNTYVVSILKAVIIWTLCPQPCTISNCFSGMISTSTINEFQTECWWQYLWQRWSLLLHPASPPLRSP